MNNTVATVAMSVSSPTPAISRNGAAIAPRPASGMKLVSDDFPRNRFKTGGLQIPVGDEPILRVSD